MTIELISESQYKLLLNIQKTYPNLTYQNKGYDYPNKSKWSNEDLSQFNIVKTILNKHIKGFSEFNHFKLNNKNEVIIRLQYNWTLDEPYKYPFTGVGYLPLEELFKGFKNKNEE